MALQHLRSGTANKRPIPTVMSAGQIAINTNEASPGLFFKDSNGDLVKVGPVHIGTSAPNSSPDSVAATALVTGTVYQILTVGTSDFTLVGASANTVGVIFTATGTTTGDGTVSGQQGVEKGEQWLDTTGGNYVLKIYDGTAWRSEAGEFVNVTGDTMTGALLLDNAASASAPDLSFDGDANTGIYSPGADQVAISTNGTGRLFIDSSGNVGIGTSTGDAKLTVNSSGARAFEIENTGSSDSKTLTINQGNANNGATNTVLDVGSSSGNSILTTGNVGIGTTGPAAELHVENSGGNCGTRIISSTSGVSYLNLGDTADNNIGSIEYDNSVNALKLITNNNERVRIDSSGRLLVGTSSADTVVNGKIQVSANDATASIQCTRTSANSVGPRLDLVKTRSGGIVQANDALGQIAFRGQDGLDTNTIGAAIYGYADGTPGANVMPGRLVFSTTAGGSSSPTERMRIDSSGNVGIGTSNITKKLSIKDAGFCGIGLQSDRTTASQNLGGISFLNSSGTTVSDILSTVGGEIYFTTVGSERVRIDSSGRVGIKTTSMGSLYGGGDDLVIGDGGASNQGMTIYTGTSQQGIITFADGFTGAAQQYAGYLLYDHSTDSLRVATTGQERMRIDSSGRIGVGTTSPDSGSLLDVNGAINLPDDAALAWGGGTNRPAWVGNKSSNCLKAFISGAERFRIDSSGNVGIGTTSPGSLLHLQASNPVLTMRDSDTSGDNISSYILFEDSGGNDKAYIGRAGTSDLRIFGNGDTVFATGGIATSDESARIDSSGRLLVGTSSNQGDYLLQVKDGDISSTKLTGAGGGNAAQMLRFRVHNTSNTAQSASLAGVSAETVSNWGGVLTFHTKPTNGTPNESLTERMRIDSSGRVLVGGTSSIVSAGKFQVKTIYNGALNQQGVSFLHTAFSAADTFNINLLRSRDNFGGNTAVISGTRLGQINFKGYDGTDYESSGASIYAEVDGTPGSNDMPGRLVFSTTADGASSPTERMRITSAGNITNLLGPYNNTIATGVNLHITSAGTLKRVTSSAKYKTNIETLEDSYADNILNCRPVWYRALGDEENPEYSWYGFIAEEVAEIDPRLVQYRDVKVTYDEDGQPVNTPLAEPEPEGVSYERFVPHLVNLIKRQQSAIETLEQRLSNAGIA